MLTFAKDELPSSLIYVARRVRRLVCFTANGLPIMKRFYNLLIWVTCFGTSVLFAAPLPEDGPNPKLDPDPIPPFAFPLELPPDVPQIEPLPFPSCKEQLALRALQLSELFYSSRSAQISMLERQLSQLAILIDDWRSIPLSGSYFEAMLIRREILATALLQITDVLKRIGTLPGATKEDKITVHDILNIFDIAAKSSNDIAKIDYFDDEAREKASGFITAVMYSRLHRELPIILEVLLRTNIHASYFHDTRPRTLKEKISVTAVCTTVTRLFPNFVSCPGIMTDKNAQELIIEIDMQSVITSLANLNKNAKEAFAAFQGGNTSIPYEPDIHVELVTPTRPFASQMTIDGEKRAGSRTFVFGEQAPNASYLMISLVDKAGGMPLGKFPKLLERGNTGHADAERGIGLFSVGREVERHRGVVHVLTNLSSETRPVGGTEISLYFPLPEKQEARPVEQVKKPTIIVIDDHRSTHILLKSFLTKIVKDPEVPEAKRGYEVLCYLSREAAIKAMNDGSAGIPEIIFSDFQTTDTDVSMEALAVAAKPFGATVGRMSAINMGITSGPGTEPLPEGFSFDVSKPPTFLDIRATVLDLLADPEGPLPPMPIPDESGS